ncbi:hypothetical protein AAFN85_03325 [Mucilaginibacter sp. CAU 1740]|uniref:hypothetical protein n=1 Tax=Mucilaginibacter sp. CAU 1740 TaxID=3140365 RepID=UPI00325BC34D
MRRKTHIGFWIFTLGVLVFLLRPYMVYQVSAKDRAGSGAFGMLQRSVKKNDEHHACPAEAFSATEAYASRLAPIRKLLVSFFQFLLLFSIPAVSLRAVFSRPVVACTRRYALTSCLLI